MIRFRAYVALALLVGASGCAGANQNLYSQSAGRGNGGGSLFAPLYRLSVEQYEAMANATSANAPAGDPASDRSEASDSSLARYFPAPNAHRVASSTPSANSAEGRPRMNASGRVRPSSEPTGELPVSLNINLPPDGAQPRAVDNGAATSPIGPTSDNRALARGDSAVVPAAANGEGLLGDRTGLGSSFLDTSDTPPPPPNATREASTDSSSGPGSNASTSTDAAAKPAEAGKPAAAAKPAEAANPAATSKRAEGAASSGSQPSATPNMPDPWIPNSSTTTGPWVATQNPQPTTQWTSTLTEGYTDSPYVASPQTGDCGTLCPTCRSLGQKKPCFLKTWLENKKNKPCCLKTLFQNKTCFLKNCFLHKKTCLASPQTAPTPQAVPSKQMPGSYMVSGEEPALVQTSQRVSLFARLWGGSSAPQPEPAYQPAPAPQPRRSLFAWLRPAPIEPAVVTMPVPEPVTAVATAPAPASAPTPAQAPAQAFAQPKPRRAGFLSWMWKKDRPPVTVPRLPYGAAPPPPLVPTSTNTSNIAARPAAYPSGVVPTSISGVSDNLAQQR